MTLYDPTRVKGEVSVLIHGSQFAHMLLVDWPLQVNHHPKAHISFTILYKFILLLSGNSLMIHMCFDKKNYI